MKSTRLALLESKQALTAFKEAAYICTETIPNLVLVS